jgi:hypothetical protein
VKLAELHADLKIQERDELNWKKLKVEGLDEDGEKEAKLTHNLNGTFLLFPGGGAGSSIQPQWCWFSFMTQQFCALGRVFIPCAVS